MSNNESKIKIFVSSNELLNFGLFNCFLVVDTKLVLLNKLSEGASRSQLGDNACLSSNFPQNLLDRVGTKLSLLLLKKSLPNLVLNLIKLLIDTLNRLDSTLDRLCRLWVLLWVFFLLFFSEKLRQPRVSHTKRSQYRILLLLELLLEHRLLLLCAQRLKFLKALISLRVKNLGVVDVISFSSWDLVRDSADSQAWISKVVCDLPH